MSNKKENKPKIRFPEFTDDWGLHKLGELCSITMGQSPDGATYSDEPSTYILVQGNSDLKDGWVEPRLWTTQKTKTAEPGDFIMSVRAPAGAMGKTAYDVVLGRGVAGIKGNEFIYQKLKLMEINNYWKKLAVGSTFESINFKDINNAEIFIPNNICEQNIIGKFFIKIDLLIYRYQRKLDILKKIKDGFLQRLFPKKGETNPEIRFPGFTNDWEKYALKEFGNATAGSSIESEFSEDGIYKVINIGSYSEDSKYRDQGIRAIDSEKTHKQLLNKNDLTMILNDKTASGNIIGRVLLIDISNTYVYNQRTERIELNCQKFYPLFIYEMLNAPDIRRKIIKQAQGNTQIYVNWSNISLIEYKVPALSEQQILGEFFHLIDKLIMLHQRKLEILKNIKKGLLQQMFV